MTVTHPPPPLPLVAHGISDGQISISGNIFSFTQKLHPIPHPFRPFLRSAPHTHTGFLPLPHPSPEGVTAKPWIFRGFPSI
jgi:hypothetical protein